VTGNEREAYEAIKARRQQCQLLLDTDPDNAYVRQVATQLDAALDWMEAECGGDNDARK